MLYLCNRKQETITNQNKIRHYETPFLRIIIWRLRSKPMHSEEVEDAVNAIVKELQQEVGYVEFTRGHRIPNLL